MNSQRGKLVALLAAVGLAMTGCNNAGPGDDPAGAVPADPKQALAASTQEIVQQGNYTFTVSGDGQSGQGVMHLPSRSMSMSLELTGEEKGTVDVRFVEPDGYVRMKMDLGEEAADLPESEAELAELKRTSPELAGAITFLVMAKTLFNGKKWLHVDTAEMKDADFPIGVENADALGTKLLLDNVVTAESTGERRYAGTIDVTAVADDETPLDSAVVKALGPQAQALPFTASLDEQGRLATLTLDVPAAGESAAHQVTIEITGYGTGTPQQKPPAGQVRELPADAYEMFKG